MNGIEQRTKYVLDNIDYILLKDGNHVFLISFVFIKYLFTFKYTSELPRVIIVRIEYYL